MLRVVVAKDMALLKLDVEFSFYDGYLARKFTWSHHVALHYRA